MKKRAVAFLAVLFVLLCGLAMPSMAQPEHRDSDRDRNHYNPRNRDYNRDRGRGHRKIYELRAQGHYPRCPIYRHHHVRPSHYRGWCSYWVGGYYYGRYWVPSHRIWERCW